MIRVDPGNRFGDWREQARRLIGAGIPPDQIVWGAEEDLFSAPAPVLPAASGQFRVPTAFLEMARPVACHRDDSRWALLYRILWRLVRGGEKHLLDLVSDPDVSRAREFSKSVRREIHKMHAFVRFRKCDQPDGVRERYVAWFEPDHWIVGAAAPFFRDRFTTMDWSIFTPKGCAHWLEGILDFSAGVAIDPCDHPDQMEEIWKTYYRSIFNPARLKEKAMKAEMPQRYWRNLPEAELIRDLIQDSRRRVGEMLEEPQREVRPRPKNAYLADLRQMSEAAAEESTPTAGAGASLHELGQMVQRCRACPLWEKATCAVAGKGTEGARIMIVGEQPGDREDLTGEPFVGPAGQLLDRALQAAGVNRETAYVTNAVKHFKYEVRGKHRLHKNPDRAEVEACRPWLLAEHARIAPEVLILLGGTAALSLLGPGVKITRDRGLVAAPQLAPKVILTVHPSYLLRLPGAEEKQREFERFVADLSFAGLGH